MKFINGNFKFSKTSQRVYHSDGVLRKGMLVLIATAALLLPANGQSPLVATDADEGWFDQLIGIENTGIINGRQYKMKMLGNSSHPFLREKELVGTVRYRQNVFTLPLLYDIYLDEIIAIHQNPSRGNWFVQLDKKVVQEFTIDNHLFRNIGGAFYEVVFESANFLLLSKRGKVSKIERGITNYVDRDEFYLVRSENWKPLSSVASIRKALTSKEDIAQLKSFVRQNHIKVRKFKHEDLVKVATFVDRLLD